MKEDSSPQLGYVIMKGKCRAVRPIPFFWLFFHFTLLHGGVWGHADHSVRYYSPTYLYKGNPSQLLTAAKSLAVAVYIEYYLEYYRHSNRTRRAFALPFHGKELSLSSVPRRTFRSSPSYLPKS